MKDVKSLGDEALAELVRSQDQELYREIMIRYQDKLMRYASYLVQDENQAADVVQEAFIKAFVNLHGFQTKKKFSSWIYRIVHNEAINYLKKHRREISLENNQWLEQKIKSDDNIEEDFSNGETREMLNQCLKKLPVKYREPLVLFYLENNSYEEISDVLQLPLGTVGTRISRGKKMMRVIYEKG